MWVYLRYHYSVCNVLVCSLASPSDEAHTPIQWMFQTPQDLPKKGAEAEEEFM